MGRGWVGNATVDDRDWLTARFEEQRVHLRGVAYRMLGSLSEADDAVQETWLRLSSSDTAALRTSGDAGCGELPAIRQAPVAVTATGGTTGLALRLELGQPPGRGRAIEAGAVI